jgi:hypothetical protein
MVYYLKMHFQIWIAANEKTEREETGTQEERLKVQVPSIPS